MIDNPYLSPSRDRYPDIRHSEVELRSWWCEFLDRERERERRGLEKGVGRTVMGWVHGALHRFRGGDSNGEAPDDAKRQVAEATSGREVLGLQRRTDSSGSGSVVLEDASLKLLDDLLLAHGEVVVKIKKDGVRLEAPPTETGQRQSGEGGA